LPFEHRDVWPRQFPTQLVVPPDWQNVFVPQAVSFVHKPWALHVCGWVELEHWWVPGVHSHPVPVSIADPVPPGEAEIDSVPLLAPVDVGLKFALIVQVALDASVLVQLFVDPRMKSPVTDGAPSVPVVEPPVFVTVNVFSALVLPRSKAPKSEPVVGVTVSAAAVRPVPDSVAVPVVAPDALTLRLADFAPPLVGENLTCTLHVKPGPSVALVHVSVCLTNWDMSVPVTLAVMAALVSAPVLVTVKVFVALLVFTVTEPKGHVVGLTERAGPASAANVAVTPFVAMLNVGAQVPVPLHPEPDQPMNVCVPSGIAVRIGLDENDALQVVGQLMPPPVTVPPPAFVTVTCAVPVPVTVWLAVPPGVAMICNVPFFDPTDCGVNFALMRQVAPAASVLVQVLVEPRAKSPDTDSIPSVPLVEPPVFLTVNEDELLELPIATEP
jgi:hypothetical protein